MSDKAPLVAVVAAFTSDDGASAALRELKNANRNELHVQEAAVIVRDSDGKLKIEESHHIGKGAVLGGIAGGVVGLVAGPVGWLALGGVAVGALAQRLRDTGFPDTRLREIGEGLKPGTSALIAIVELRWVTELENQLRATAADIVTESLRDEVAAQLDESTAAPSTGSSSTPASSTGSSSTPNDNFPPPPPVA
jgi:uncharacterized membrane protein